MAIVRGKLPAPSVDPFAALGRGLPDTEPSGVIPDIPGLVPEFPVLAEPALSAPAPLPIPQPMQIPASSPPSVPVVDRELPLKAPNLEEIQAIQPTPPPVPMKTVDGYPEAGFALTPLPNQTERLFVVYIPKRGDPMVQEFLDMAEGFRTLQEYLRKIDTGDQPGYVYGFRGTERVQVRTPKVVYEFTTGSDTIRVEE
jgi:hypothetical protein